MTTATDDVMECCYAFAGPFGSHVKGEIVRKDHPSVALNPAAWVHPSTPHAERPTGWEGLDRVRAERDAERLAEERRDFENEAKANPIKLSGPDLVRATADHFARLYGRPALVRKGSVVAADDDLVSQNPDLWKAN